MACTIDKCQLVRRGSIVGDILLAILALFLICNDCMAKTKRFNKCSNHLIVWVVFVLHVLLKIRVLEVHICDTGCVIHTAGLIGTILVHASGELLELHHILSQSACFIAENVLYHAKLLIQITLMHFARYVSLSIIDIDIQRDEISNEEIAHLESDNERNRHELLQSDEPDS